MPFRLGRWIIVLTVVFATGSHWFFLQSIAWVGMTVEFSRTEALGTALQKTFDGQHPCNLCKLVQEGQKAERKGDMKVSSQKFDLFCERTVGLTAEPMPFRNPVAIPQFPTPRLEAPPTPPPRFTA